MSHLRGVPRHKLEGEVERLKAENRRLQAGGKEKAAATLIVSELFKLARASGTGPASGCSGEEFVSWWKKVLEERSEVALIAAALTDLGPALETTRDHIRSCMGTDQRPESDSAEIVRMCDAAIEKVAEVLSKTSWHNEVEKKRAKFKEGDRVKLWGKSQAEGTVDEVWFDGPNEIVAVVWDVSGCVGDCRAHLLQHAAARIEEAEAMGTDLLEDFREDAAEDGSKSFSTAAVQLLIAKIDRQSEQIVSLTKERDEALHWRDAHRAKRNIARKAAKDNHKGLERWKSRAEAAEQEAARYREMWEQNAAAANAAVQEKLTLEERLSELAQEAVKVVEHADDEDWRRLFTMIDDSGPGRFWKEVLSDWRTFLSKLKGSMS